MQWCQHKENGTTGGILFHQHLHYNFTAYFRFYLLHLPSYFGPIFPNAVAIISIKNDLHKSCSALEPKMLVQLDPYCLPSTYQL